MSKAGEPRGAPSWSAKEDEALKGLVITYGDNWRLYRARITDLDNRDTRQCERRLWYTKHYDIDETYRKVAAANPNMKRRPWPKIGTKLFHDDPRAVRDHGSPGLVQQPQVYHSYTGSSMGWAQ